MWDRGAEVCSEIEIHKKRSARLPYVHHDMVTNRGVFIVIEVVMVGTISWREGVLRGRSLVWSDRSRVYTRIDALP
jgi:hypothetical protein